MFNIKLPFIGSISDIYKKLTGQNPDGTNTFTEDLSDFFGRMIMGWLAKVFLDALPKNIYKDVFAGNDKGQEWLKYAPTVIRSLTHFSDFTDDMITEFFERVSQELERRRGNRTAMEEENKSRKTLLDLLNETTDEAEKQKIALAFNNLFQGVSEAERERLTIFLADLDKAELKTFLLLDRQSQRNVLCFADVTQGEGEGGLNEAVKKFAKSIGTGLAKLDNLCAPGTDFDKFSNEVELKAKAFYDRARGKKRSAVTTRRGWFNFWPFSWFRRRRSVSEEPPRYRFVTINFLCFTFNFRKKILKQT